MSDAAKITPSHRSRTTIVYLRQSSREQVLCNRESTDRQYGLVARAEELGWNRSQITIIDQDLGLTGSGFVERSGFDHLTAQVALGRVGLVLSLEVSRVARNNAEWYRVLDLCAVTNTLIGDSDGLYHPGQFNDRLLLGMKGTMSEMEIHVLRARLDGGIRNKAARGELRRGLPVGLVWGEGAGEVCFHPDEAVTGAIHTTFERFAEMGSVRQVWLWFRAQGLTFPLQLSGRPEIQWVVPTYTAVHRVLTNPAYAGAYTYGKTHQERYIDEQGRMRKRTRKLPRAEWKVLIRDHHKGFIDWETHEANLRRIAANTRPRRHDAGGAVREGAALLQGIAACGHCGRKLRVYYPGKGTNPGYHCPGASVVNGRGSYCLRVGGRQIDDAVAKAFLAAITPAGVDAALQATARLESDRDAALAQWRLAVERARYEAERAERRFRAVEPENRLVGRTIETEWNERLRQLATAEVELAHHEQRTPRVLDEDEHRRLRQLGTDLDRVWAAPTTTARDRKELLRALLQEVVVVLERAEFRARLTLRWLGGALTEIEVPLPRSRPAALRTDESTIDLVRRLVVHHPDATIAGILNRQGRWTVRGERFTASKVGSLRRYRKIPCFKASPQAPEGELMTIAETAKILAVAASTVHRWLNDGFIAGEQITPGAPWRIRITDDFRSRFVEDAPTGWVPMREAMQALDVSRQTVLRRLNRGDLEAVYVQRGRQKGLRIKLPPSLATLFDTQASPTQTDAPP